MRWPPRWTAAIRRVLTRIALDRRRTRSPDPGQSKLRVTLILDLMHVMEKLWKAAYVFHAEGSLEADLWVLERTLRILIGDVGQVVKGLRQSVTKRRLSGPKAKRCRPWPPTSPRTAPTCATTNTSPRAGPLPAARSKAPARI